MKTALVEKTLIFQNAVTEETNIMKAKVEIQDSGVRMFPIITMVEGYRNSTFRMYNVKTKMYQPLNSLILKVEDSGNFMISSDYLDSDIILFKYSVIVNSQAESIVSAETTKEKKKRSKERNIGEVIELVGKWRQRYFKQKRNVRKNLQQSADCLQISKKSLDDYYYQLRLGERYGFDFRTHWFQKIGTLRKFIKMRKISDQDFKKEKLKKNLNIISEVNVVEYMKLLTLQNEGQDSNDQERRESSEKSSEYILFESSNSFINSFLSTSQK